MKPSKVVEEIALKLTERLQEDLRTQGSELPLGAGRELQLGIERELTTLKARVREETVNEVKTLITRNTTTETPDPDSRGVLFHDEIMDAINSINTKEE